jgi:cytidine deaminase
VTALLKVFRSGHQTSDSIYQWLLELRSQALTPESGFAVSTVFRAKLGDRDDFYFAGVNAESCDHRLSTHGEEGAIAAAMTGLGRHAELVEGWVMGAPANIKPNDISPFTGSFASCCGKCRQQLAGLAAPQMPIHEMALNGQSQTVTLGESLPRPFSFRNFSAPVATNTVTSPAPEPTHIAERLIRQRPQDTHAISQWLRELDSVDEASKISQSIVLRLDNGAYVAGVKVEEAAFVSISAAQAAVAITLAEFGPCHVEEAWVFTKGRDGKELQPRQYGTLPLSGLQTLLQVATSPDIPLHYIAVDGHAIDATLLGAALLAPSSARPLQTYTT